MRDKSVLRFDVCGSTLFVVPAMHYRVAFAQAVNNAVCAPDSKPEAIAVEIPPSVALTATQWLREIGIGPDRHVRLPCLLGIETQQHYLSPDVRERAVTLQRTTGLELWQFPPELLEMELNFRSCGLVPLSPTDSIVEALRSALELNIPAFGVDLEEFADVERHECLFPDPLSAAGRLGEYLRKTAQDADLFSTSAVDERRELAMAARLKELLSTYERVLFTCGIGHWRRIVGLVRDSAVSPTRNVHSLTLRRSGTAPRRVVVDPSIAFQFLDRLPAVASSFESWRSHPLLDDQRAKSRPLSVPGLFRRTLRSAMRGHLKRNRNSKGGVAGYECRIHRLIEFPRRIAIMAQLRLDDVPGVSTVLRCAETWVSSSFAMSVAEKFLRFPWAEAKDFRNCRPLLPSNRLRSSGEKLHFARGQVFSEAMRVPGVEAAEWIGFKVSQSEISSTADDFAEKKGNAYGFTWTPWEHLITGLSDDAISLLASAESPRQAEPYCGCMHRGLAWKDTLRSRLTGDTRFYVHPAHNHALHTSHDLSEGWPVVWIFDAEEENAGRWSDYVIPLEWVAPYLDRSFSRQVIGAGHNRYMTSVLCFAGSEQRCLFSSGGANVRGSELRGLIVFAPVFSRDEPYARWLELTHGSHNPIYRHKNWAGVPRVIAARCEALGTPLGRLRWQDDIVRMAIPYAGRNVTVVAPRHFRPDPLVYREATQIGKRLQMLRLDEFSAAEIARAKQNVAVPGAAHPGGPQYDSDAAAALAEDPQRFAHRMPQRWKSFGL